MFGQFHGLPVHALIVHAAVALFPLTALVAIAFLVPRWRRVLRWPLVTLAALTVAIGLATRQSGEVLKTAIGDQLTGNVTGAVVADHETLGTRLVIAAVVLLVLAIVAVVVARSARGGWPWQLPSGALAVVAVLMLVLTVQTGEAGATARWNPDGSFDYSGS